jgi:hypothetical protein
MCKHKINAYFHVGGRLECWAKFSTFLTHQTYNHNDIKLIVINTTPEHQIYKKWLNQCDYEYAYIETPLKSRNREERLQEMNANQDDILKNHVSAEYLWTLDDDVIPPKDVVKHLLPHFSGNVMAVSACYRLAPRIGRSHLYCAWPHNPKQSQKPLYYRKNTGVKTIGGCGWGCCLLKLQNCSLFCPLKALPKTNGDVALFYRIKNLGGIAKINWDIECEHLTDDGVNLFPTRQVKFI